MKVLKFGGTSVGTVESLRNVKNIVESLEEPAIVVVSALGGLTDFMIATARKAAAADDTYAADMEAIKERHHHIIDSVVCPERREKTLSEVDSLLERLAEIYKGVSMIHDLSSKTLDLILSFGERMSSVIVAAMLSRARHYDSLQFMKTERWFDSNIADRPLTDSLIKKTFSLPLEETAVMGGFISTDRDSGQITNLGRGGSDYSAALVAAALDAELLEIWTDVDGFMTADPRIIKEASVIPSMTFVESMELCSFGAKVIYPPTIYPVFHKNIPIKILNTFNPKAPGTLIKEATGQEEPGVSGVSSVRDVAIVTISGRLNANIPITNSRTYNCMARQGIQMYLVAQPDDARQFTFALRHADASKALEALQREFEPELTSGLVDSIQIRDGLSIVVMVGEGLSSLKGMAARSANTLERNDVKIVASSDNKSETTVAHVVDGNDTEAALRLLHGFCRLYSNCEKQ